MKRKGFTLIELIVVMAIISILVLLGVPKYKAYTQEAHLTKIKVNVKELENASMQYYIKYNDWPRLNDVAYTSEQIDNFGKQILDKTGAVVTLETDGKYYDIDFSKVDNYVKVPDDKVNYILQNPVGKVFFIEGITKEAKSRIPDNTNGSEEPELPEEPEIPEIPFNGVFQGSNLAAFDKNNTTNSNILGDITWEGSLDNKKITIDLFGSRSTSYDPIKFTIYDIEGNQLNFIDLTNNKAVNNITHRDRKVTEILVPEGAVKFNISGDGLIYDIYVTDNLESPKAVYDITSSSTDSSITLTWKQDDANYEKVAIFRDGAFLTLASGKTFIDKPLYSDMEHTYSFKALNSYGNGSKGLINHTQRTTTPEIIFRGLEPSAFDKDSNTITYSRGDITWEGNLENKKVIIETNGSGSTSYKPVKLTIYDINGNLLNFINLTSNIEVNFIAQRGRTLTEFLVPDGAVKFNISETGSVYDIYVSDNLESPESVYEITSTSTDNSITLNWKQDNLNYEKTAVYRDNKLISIATGKTFTDKPLYSNATHIYTLKSINIYGNSSTGFISHTASTTVPEIIFRGLEASAFDKVSATLTSLRGDVTWTGDLGNKKVTIEMSGGIYSTSKNNLKIYDINGKELKFIDLSTNQEVNIISTLGSYKQLVTEIIVPNGAVKFTISGEGRVHDIYVTENLETPESVYDVTSISTDSSITLNWKQDSLNYEKTAIYRDGVFLTLVSGKTFTDKPLYSNSEHSYSLKAINSYGNISSGLVSYIASTTVPEIIFRGLSPAVFDKINTTSFANTSGEVTWEGNLLNKKVMLDMQGYNYGMNVYQNMTFQIYDINNNILNFMNLTDNTEVNVLSIGARVVKEIIVPDGAAKFVLKGAFGTRNFIVYDIYVTE